MNPKELKYSKTHEWMSLEDADGGKIATVGISKFALEALTDLVFMDLPEVGRSVNAGDVFGQVESVKAVSDLYCPIAGEIVEVNEAISDNLDGLTDDPYGTGWLIKIRAVDDAATVEMLDYEDYEKQIAEAEH